MSRKKFKIFYPDDHPDPKLAGKRYKCKGKDMIVVNEQGIFFMFNGERYYPSIRPLNQVSGLSKYDVVWNDEEETI